VFSTLHTINAIASVNRLLDMGAPGYMIAAALHGVIAQRLVKRVCTDCAQPAMPTANELAWLAACRPDLKPDDHRFVAGAGCTYCNLTGTGAASLFTKFSRSTARWPTRFGAAISRVSPRCTIAGGLCPARSRRDRFRVERPHLPR